MTRMDRLAELITGRRRTVVVLVLLATLVIGIGAPTVELSTSMDEFRGGTEAAKSDEYVKQHFGVGAPNATRTMLIFHGDIHVLTKRHYLRQLRFQQAMREDERINGTLVAEEPPVGLANVIATISIKQNFRLERETASTQTPERDETFDNITLEPMPPLEEQIEEIEAMDRQEVQLYTAVALQTVLAEPGHGGPEGGTFAMVPPAEFAEDDGGIIHTTTMIVPQRDDLSSDRRAASQVAMRDLASEVFADRTEVMAFGTGIINDELERSTRDSLFLVGPLAILFVIIVLFFAYRDWTDIALGIVGLALVQIWTFGFMGWADITFNQLFAAAPVLLVGLAIDYAIHTFMRYREARTGPGPDPGTRQAMTIGLAGLLAALVLVTISTAIGFSSNVASPVPPIRDFGLVTAMGILASLAVFGALIPAVKIDVDQWLETRGHDRRLRPFGADETTGRYTTLLDRSVQAAREVPWTVVALTALAASAGVAAGVQVDTAFDQEELLVHEVPAWAEMLPQPFAPGEYQAASTLEFIKTHQLAYDGAVAHVLVRGDVADDDALERMDRAHRRANRSAVVLPSTTWTNPASTQSLASPSRSAAVVSPLTVMRDAADDYRSFNRTFQQADTDGDGIPDQNVSGVYDALYEVRPVAASSVIYRTDGEYRALRLSVLAKSSADNAAIRQEMQAVAVPLEGNGLRATPTGEPVMLAVVTSQLLDTIVRSMVITLLTVLTMLVFVYWRYRGSATLGVVTLLPVLVALTWIVGTMYLLSVPFNVMTALITSFTIGLGVDYSIHVSERYVLELGRTDSTAEALRTSVFGTGGALLGSAMTTAGGFGVLVFSILHPLQQFGLVTALTIVYSFIASVIVLPSLLVLWSRHLQPAGYAARVAAAADD